MIRHNSKRLLRCFSALLVMVIIILCAAPGRILASESERETVKVGFFQWDGYHMEDERGIRSGYGYDFLKMAEDYNNWKYEYVGYDKSWSDMLEMLDAGEIDLVTSAQKTPEWEERFDYSDSPIGTSAICLSVRADDDRYTVEDTATYDGMRVAVLEDSSRNERFRQFALNNGFTYTPVYYNNLDAMKKALSAGDVDGMVASNLRSCQGEKILEEFDPTDFYVVVRKGNTQLLKEINYAISQMDMNTPGWRLTLKNTYFSSSVDDISFTGGEIEYIEGLKAENRVLNVVTNPDLAPYSYIEDGQAKGIAIEIFDEIARRLGIEYRVIPIDTYKEYNEYVRAGKADIDLTCFSSYGLAEYHGILLSNSYMSTALAMLTRSNFSGDIKSIAEIGGAENNTIYSQQLFDNITVITYDTHEECIEAVARGEVDGTYLYTYCAQKAVEDDVRNRLTYTVIPAYSIDMAIGINEDADYRLLSIIDKGIKNTRDDFTQQVIQNNISDISGTHTILSVLYDYPGMALGLLGTVLFVAFSIVIVIVRTRGRKKERQQSDELARFMGYVCEANAIVMEVNLATLTCTVHNMKDGELVSTDMPFKFAQYSNYNEMIYPEDFERIIKEINAESFENIFKKNNKSTYFEARCKNDSGEYVWYAYTMRQIPKDKKHPNSFILFKKNIDSVKKEEEAKKQALEDALENARMASKAKGQFLSKMSHEIRTPLNAVIGYMDIAGNSAADEEKIMHCIDNGKIAARHLLSIINDVLDMSSIESGKMKIANEEFDFKNQLTTIATLFYNQAVNKKIRFEVQLSEITQEWVVGDSLRVNQILMNLLSNSIKFTPEGGRVCLNVSQMRMDEDKVYMKFIVSDTGIGMSEEYKQRIFKPFEQESASTAGKYGGTGLGLSITNNLVNMMGGSIDVQSEAGKGTTFTVLLHFGRVSTAHGSPDVPHDYSNIRALIVDDEKNSCEYVKSLLARCMVKSDIVFSGEAAVKQIQRRMGGDYSYNLCIMDWNMPGLNGIETARQIHELCPQGLPVIIATAYDASELDKEAKEAGVSRVISKPLFQSTMFDLLVSLYGKYEPVSESGKQVNNLKGLHVLLAEDNEMNMEIAVDILTGAGITVSQAVDGQQALDMFTASTPGTYDVILMDVQMPVMDGYQATAGIRASAHPQASDIPIIAMTANAFAEDVSAALACGMNGHIAKPIDYDKLFKVLKEYNNIRGDQNE